MANRNAHMKLAELPPWLNDEDLVDRVTIEEIRHLTAQAEALEPTIRALCIRAFHADRRYCAQIRGDEAMQPAAAPLILRGALSSLAAHLKGVIEGLAADPDWR
jgi:hypothetical protein